MFTDIHTHILPGVDDGSDDTENSFYMLRQAAAAGTDRIALTPHFANRDKCRRDYTSADIRALYTEFKKEVIASDIPISIFLGAEILCSGDPIRLFSGDILTLNGTDFVLIEFYFNSSADEILSYANAARAAGLFPIIAHPERYRAFKDSPYSVYDLLEKGCLLQINKDSISGGYGSGAARLAVWLVRNRLVHLVCSDCHDSYERDPDMSSAYSRFTEFAGRDYLERLFKRNADMILRGINP